MKSKRFDMIMVIFLLAYFIILVDTSLVFTCSSEIGATFRMDTAQATWISNAYALTFGSLLLVGGRLGDLYGRRRVFIVGLAIFGLSSLGVGLAVNGSMLIATRAIQGVGAAIIAPATLAIIMDNYQGDRRAHAITVYGAMSGIGVSLGLIIGAGITTVLSWRYGFFINLPITGILIILSLYYLPAGTRAPLQLDWWGTVTSFGGVVLLINGINGIGNNWLSLILGTVLFSLFVLHEMHDPAALIPKVIFRSRQRIQAYLIRFCYSAAITGFWFLTPRVLQSLYHLSPISVGVSFLPMTLVNYYAARRVDQLSKRWGSERLLLIGLIIAGIGFSGLLTVRVGSNYWLSVALPMVLIGYGQGLVLSPVTTIAVTGLAPEVAGIGSGLINIMLQLGGVTGLTLLTTWSTGATVISAYHGEVWGISGFVLISLLLAFNLVRRGHPATKN